MHENTFEIEICTPAKELHVTMSLDKYANLIKCKIWRRNWNKRKYTSLGSSSRSQKMKMK